jgi:3-dehydroquinate dehydratase
MRALLPCWRCRHACEQPAPLTRAQLVRLFAVLLEPLRDDVAKLAESVTDLARHCAECVDVTLDELHAHRDQAIELINAGATQAEADLVLAARRAIEGGHS